MKLTRRWKLALALPAVFAFGGLLLTWHIGGTLVQPANRFETAPPEALHAERVQFLSGSGSTIHGWFVPGEPGKGVVVLMHGVHAGWRTMLPRAEWLAHDGRGILMFDFQGHGESPGKHITFGFLESRDATAAVDFIQQKSPGEKIAVIGVSMGAAAALLAKPPLPVAGMVLESCYPTIYQAAEDRMVDRFGFILGKLATPLLTCQLPLRLGIGPDDLKPIQRAHTIGMPKLFIAGSTDRLTTARESEDLYEAAAVPKDFWLVPGAGHVDLLAFAGTAYERRVMSFLCSCLDQKSPAR